jgi:protein-tyrosine phosphatase
MIDLHCHILPGMDDGSKNMDVSVQMCRIARQNGIKHIVCTPHITTVGDIDSFVKIRNEKLRDLQGIINNIGLGITLYPGAEVYVDDDIFFSTDLKRLAINGSRYILVEFAFRDVSMKRIVNYLNALIDMGLIPIVAHPERYEYFQFDYDEVNMLIRNGVLFQINASSLASLDGPQEFELAYAMAYTGAASFIATDAHSSHYRMNDLMNMINFFPPDISQFNMQMMVHDAAKCVLTDKEVPLINRGEIYKRGF